MKFNNFGLYALSVSLIANLPSLALAGKIDESKIFKLPTTTDNLESDNNQAQLLLLSESEPDGNTTIEEQQTSEEETETEYTQTPFQLIPLEPMTVETANTLPAGTLDTSFSANIFPTGSEGSGLGLQVYNASIEYGIKDNLQIGADLSFFDDVLSTKFNGQKWFI